MLKSETRQIGAYKYTVTQMPGRKSFQVFTQLAKMIGPALTEMLGKGVDMKRLMETDTSRLIPAVVMFFDGLEIQHMNTLIDTFSEHTKVSGENISKQAPLTEMFDIVFAGAPGSIVRWLGFCIEVNYKDFLADLQQSAPASGE